MDKTVLLDDLADAKLELQEEKKARTHLQNKLALCNGLIEMLEKEIDLLEKELDG